MVTKYPPKEDTGASSNNGSKAFAHENEATMAAKYSPRNRPAILWNKVSVRKETNDHGGKVSARDNDSQVSAKERAIAAKHPL